MYWVLSIINFENNNVLPEIFQTPSEEVMRSYLEQKKIVLFLKFLSKF